MPFDFRPYLVKQGILGGRAAQAPAEPYQPGLNQAPNADQVAMLRALTAAGMRPAVGGFGMSQLAQAQAQPQPAPVEPAPYATAGQPNSVMMARILQGMAEEEKARTGDATPEIVSGGVAMPNPGTYAESGMSPQQYSDAVIQVTRNWLRDYWLKKSADAAAANAPGTQLPEIPYVDPAINAAVDFGGNVVKGVGVAGREGGAALKDAGAAVVDEATGLGQEIGQKYVERTTPHIVGVDPYSGEPIYGQASPIGASYTSVADTLIPAAASGVADVGGAVVKPVAGAVGDAYGWTMGNTWDRLSPEQKMDTANAVGLDHPPTKEELTQAAGKVIAAFDYPRAEVGAPLIGELFYMMVKGDAPFGLGAVGQFLSDDAKKAIIDAYEKGGGKGVWEDWIAKGADFALDPNNPFGQTLGLVYYALYHAGIDLAADPMTWLPILGSGLKSVAAARAMGELALGAEDVSRTTKILNAAGVVLEAPNTVPDAIVSGAAKLPGRMLPEQFREAMGRIAGLKPGEDVLSGRAMEDMATSLHAYQQAENAVERAPLPGSSAFPAFPNERPIYVSSDGNFIVTNGPAKMKGQPEQYFVYDKQGHLVGMAMTPEQATDLAEQVAFRRGAARDAGERFSAEMQPPTAQAAQPAPQAAASGNTVMLDGATGKWTVYLDDGSKWPFETRAEANAFKAEIESAPVAEQAAPNVSEPIAAQNAAPEPVSAPVETPLPAAASDGGTVLRPAQNGMPAVVEPRPKPVPGSNPDNRLPGWSVEPRPGGSRLVDTMNPAAYDAIKAEVIDRATNYYEPMLNATRKSDPVGNALLNADLELNIRDTAAKHGVAVSPEQWDISKAHLAAAKGDTKRARMQRILFTADEAATKPERNFLYQSGDLRDTPPRSFENIVSAEPGNVRGTKIKDAVVVPDSVYETLPPSIRRYSAGKDAIGPQGRMGHLFTKADLQAMTEQQRRVLAQALERRQQEAYANFQLMQDYRARIHGQPQPERPAASAVQPEPAAATVEPPAPAPTANGNGNGRAVFGQTPPAVEEVAAEAAPPPTQSGPGLFDLPPAQDATPMRAAENAPTNGRALPNEPDSAGPDAIPSAASAAQQEAMIRNLPQGDLDWLDQQVAKKRIWEHERDRYRETGVQKVPAGVDRDGETIYRYPYTPEVFIKSDASGMPMRRYIQLPSGKVIHPDEIERIKAVRLAAKRAEMNAPENVARVEAERAREREIHRMLSGNPRYQQIRESASRRAFGQPNSTQKFEQILAQNSEYQAMRADAIRQLDEAAQAVPAEPVVHANGAQPNGAHPPAEPAVATPEPIGQALDAWRAAGSAEGGLDPARVHGGGRTPFREKDRVVAESAGPDAIVARQHRQTDRWWLFYEYPGEGYFSLDIALPDGTGRVEAQRIADRVNRELRAAFGVADGDELPAQLTLTKNEVAEQNAYVPAAPKAEIPPLPESAPLREEAAQYAEERLAYALGAPKPRSYAQMAERDRAVQAAQDDLAAIVGSREAAQTKRGLADAMTPDFLERNRRPLKPRRPDPERHGLPADFDLRRYIESLNGQAEPAVATLEPPATNGRVAASEPAPKNASAKFSETTIDRISIDPSQYQMRNAPFVEEHVQNIIDTFDENNLDPLKVRENPDGTYTVLSGHNRYEAIRRMVEQSKLPADFQVPIRIVRGDEAKILDVALTSNNLSRELLPSELGANLQRQLDSGKTWTQLLDTNKASSGKARQALDINLLPNRVKELVDQEVIKPPVGAVLGEQIRKGEMTPEQVDAFWFKHGVTRTKKVKVVEVVDGVEQEVVKTVANPYTPETLKFDLKNIKSRLELEKRRAEIAAAGAEPNGMMDLFGGMTGLDFNAKAMDDLLERSQQLFDNMNALKELDKQIDTIRRSERVNLTPAAKQELERESARLRAEINQAESELGRPLTKWDKPVRKPKGDTLGFISDAFRKQQQGLEWAKNKLFQPERPTALPETGADTLDLLISEPIKAHEATGRLTLSEADLLERTITVGQGKQARSMMAYERYDELVLAGMTEKQAAIQTAREYANMLHPRAAADTRLVQRALRAYDLANQAAREGIMYNIVTGGRGSLADMLGDSYSMALTGHAGAVADQFRGLPALWRMIRKGDPIELNKISYLAEIQDAGAHLPERYVDHAWNRLAGDNAKGEMTIVRAGNKLGAPDVMSRPVQAIFQNRTWRDARNALDMSRRMSTLADQFGKEIRWGAKRFDQNLAQFAARTGQDVAELKAAILDAAKERASREGRDAWSGVFSPEDVLAATGNERLTRAWRTEVNRAMSVADQESRRVLFSYDRLPLDKGLGRVVFFHYWATRALALHTGIALRNPWLMAAYYRTWHGLNRLAEEEGYPPGLRGMAMFMGSKAGWMSFFNPLGIAVPYMMFNDIDNQNAPVWKRAGLFLSPFVEAGLAAFGATDTIPDPTGTTSVRNFALAVANWADANGVSLPGMGSDGKLSEDYIKSLEARVYGGANRALNWVGLTDKDYGPYDPKTAQTAQIRAVIIQNATDEYGPMEQWPSSLKEMVDDAIAKTMNGNMLDNPLSKAAYQEVAGAQMEKAAENAVVPGGVILKYGPLETNRALNKAGSDAWRAGGQMTPEQQAASDVMDKINAGSPESLALDTADAKYRAIGTAREQALADGWNAIVYGTGIDTTANPNVGVVIDGKGIRYADLATMSEDDRKRLADRWVANWRGKDELAAYREKRAAFLQANPEYGDYKSYQKSAFNYGGGVAKFRTDTAKANPNFAAAMARREKLIRDGGTTDPKVIAAELDKWATSKAGFEAATGVKTSLYDPQPIETRDPSKVPYIAGQEGGGQAQPPSKPKQTTVEKLTGDLAAYDQQGGLLNALMAQRGMTGGIESYQNPYLQPWLKATFGDVIPQPSALMNAYAKWIKQQPQGSDTSVEAFAAQYDAMDGIANDAGSSQSRTMTLYLAWAKAQPPGADTSPEAFARYLDALSQHAA